MKKTAQNSNLKYVTEKTFEKHMGSIARSIARIDSSLARHEQVMSAILKEIRAISEENKYFRQSIGSLYSDNSSHDRKIENLTMRVERLESKIK